MTTTLSSALFVICVTAAAVNAQSPETGSASPAGRVTASPTPQVREQDPSLVWRPTLALTGFGYDSNIFNEAADPKGDFLVTLAAGVRPVWRINLATLSGEGGLSYRYFQQYSEERGLDGRARGQFELPLGQLRLFATGSYLNVRDRPNYEIDERARRMEAEAGGGVDFVLGGHTTLTPSLLSRTVEFDESVPDLAQSLNRREQIVAFSLQHTLTPLTTVVVTGEFGRNTFDSAVARDGNTSGVAAGTRFAPGALIEGQWRVGWKHMTVSDTTSPPYSGLIGDMDFWTVFGASTRLGLRGRRDVTFSADSAGPYYTETSLTASLTFAFADRWDIDSRAERVWLDDVPGVGTVPTVSSGETVGVLALGVGFRIAGSARLGVYVEATERRDPTSPSRSYDTTRIYTAISQPWGF